MRRKIDQAKRRLLARISKSFLKSLNSLVELLVTRSFLLNPSDENYISFVIVRMSKEKERLEKAGIPEARWPRSLRGDFRKAVWESFNLTPPVREEPVKESPISSPQAEVGEK